jgi:hypothetical protein
LDPALATLHVTGATTVFDKPKPRHEQLLIGAFTVLPMLALTAAVPLAWGWGLSWVDVGLAAGFYLVSALGVTTGFHRSLPTAAPVSGCARPLCSPPPSPSSRSSPSSPHSSSR